ncbi:MAG TPA: GGDEF domain-containing protein [Isosphaeraceae bacterium]|jgi:diguanylate cyclase (GGDEF)-like protein|nr:GGDEF domain-containing protein [Isosphaeraceae bacterium]
MRANIIQRLDSHESAPERPGRKCSRYLGTDLPATLEPGRAQQDCRPTDCTFMLSQLDRAERELALARERIEELTCMQGELTSAVSRLTEIASTDVLTGLSNRRRFCEVLELTFALSVLQSTPLSLVMIDVDWFKSYNDEYGHSAGDQVLCDVAQELLGSSRSNDVVARYGGEEFAILLPSADPDQASECAERQRLAIESHGWPSRQITASFGVATLGPDGGDPVTLVEAADRALYHAKRHGRNRVIHHCVFDATTTFVRILDDSHMDTPRTSQELTDGGPSVMDQGREARAEETHRRAKRNF